MQPREKIKCNFIQIFEENIDCKDAICHKALCSDGSIPPTPDGQCCPDLNASKTKELIFGFRKVPTKLTSLIVNDETIEQIKYSIISVNSLWEDS